MSTVLLLALLALQAETPEASKKEPSEGEVILDKVRRAISSNATVRFTVTTEDRSFQVVDPKSIQGGRVTARVGGLSIDLRPGNQLKIDGHFPIRDLRWPAMPKDVHTDGMVLLSDGTSISVTPHERPVWAKRATPKTLNHDLLQDIVLLGVRTAVVERLKLLTPLQDQPKDPNPDLMRDTMITFLGKDTLDEVDTLKLEIKPRKAAGLATPVTLLWIDPKTYLPLRRETRAKGVDWERTDVELYKDFGTDPFN